jgi:hypothetical protein
VEQEFNSFHAQREAYVASQRSEGWALVRDPYDDGGFSGGTLQRPALQRLLAAIEEGLVGVTFVSVTHSFNTTTSMGRLTLNILLSFAQFEREVTAERIRDKIVASRAKGMWMGGNAPLGYGVKDRKPGYTRPMPGRCADLRPVPGDRLGDCSGAGNPPDGRTQHARQAHRQGVPLKAAEQPGLHRHLQTILSSSHTQLGFGARARAGGQGPREPRRRPAGRGRWRLGPAHEADAMHGAPQGGAIALCFRGPRCGGALL